MARKFHSAAFTLVELLVVIAIIAGMLAIAVPTMTKMGILGRDPINSASRDLVTALKAARIYASTHRVDTAVVYKVVKANNIYTVDGFVMARRLTEPEWQSLQARGLVVNDPPATTAGATALTQGSEIGTVRPFVPVSSEEGVFQSLPPDTAVASRALQYDPVLRNISGGFVPVRLYRRQRDELRLVVPPRDKDAPNEPLQYPYSFVLTEPAPGSVLSQPEYAWEWLRFPAHVFKPTGTVIVDPALGGRARVVLDIGMAPGTVPRNQDEPAPVRISLYTTTGRAQISDEGDGS